MQPKKIQLIVLVVGVVLAAAGGAFKATAVAEAPEIFSYVFFNGHDYLVFISGLMLVVLATGFDLLFGPDGPGVEAQR